MGRLSGGGELAAGAVLVVQLAGAVAVAVVGARLAGRRDVLVALLAGWLAGLTTVVAVPLVLGGMTILGRTSSVVAHVVVLGGAVWWLREHPAEAPPAEAEAGRSWLASVAVGAAVAVFALFVMLSVGPTSRDTDTREYHVTNMATWLREGSIWVLPYQSPGGVTATHPGDAELVGLWLSLPSHGDELAYLAPLPFGVLLVLGSALLARELATPMGSVASSAPAAPLGALAGTAVLTAPIIATTQSASLSNDVAVAACTVTALGFLALARHRDASTPVVLAGIALGLSLGSKYTALVPAAAVTIGALWVLPRRRLWWWLVPGVAVLALPWYVRNLAHTGNPVFPQALGPLPGGETPFQAIDDPMGAHILAGERALVVDWLEFMIRRVGPIVALALAGLLAAVFPPRTATRRVSAIVGVLAFAGYLAVPFSGGGPTGLPFLVVSSLRYSMTAVAVLCACAAAMPWHRLLAAALAVIGAWNLWQLRVAWPRDRPDVRFGDRHLAVAVLCGVVAAVIARAALGAPRPRRASVLIAAPAAAVLALVGSAVAFHRFDRGDSPGELEAALLLEGGEQEQVVVLGVVDLRSLLGPRLRRPLVGAPRGGEVGEIPFSDANQIRRLVLGDLASPSAPPTFGPALDEVLAGLDTRLLVVGPFGYGAFPEGWRPDDRWCPGAAVGQVTIFERC